MIKKGVNLFMEIRNSNSLFLKLLAAKFIVQSSKEKLRIYREKHLKIALQMQEDEMLFSAMNDYYEDNAKELKLAAQDSLSVTEEINYEDFALFDEDEESRNGKKHS